MTGSISTTAMATIGTSTTSEMPIIDEMELEESAAGVTRGVPQRSDIGLAHRDAPDRHHLTAGAEPVHEEDERDGDHARDGEDHHDEARIQLVAPEALAERARDVADVGRDVVGEACEVVAGVAVAAMAAAPAAVAGRQVHAARATALHAALEKEDESEREPRSEVEGPDKRRFIVSHAGPIVSVTRMGQA